MKTHFGIETKRCRLFHRITGVTYSKVDGRGFYTAACHRDLYLSRGFTTARTARKTRRRRQDRRPCPRCFPTPLLDLIR